MAFKSLIALCSLNNFSRSLVFVGLLQQRPSKQAKVAAASQKVHVVLEVAQAVELWNLL